MKKLPGIFNDIIGPVMRGPSSSHTAASWRIARLCIDLLNEPLKEALVEFDQDGAWAPNFREQGTTMGVEGGLLGIEITDERMKNTEAVASERGITILYQVSSFPTTHANTMRLTLTGVSLKKVEIIAVSLGGGSFEIRNINGMPVQLSGDSFVALIFPVYNTVVEEKLEAILPEGIGFSSGSYGDATCYQLKASTPFSRDFVGLVKNLFGNDKVVLVNPVMPVIAGKETEMPFTTVASLVDYSVKSGSDLGDMGILYEKCLSGFTDEELDKKMLEIIDVVNRSIDTGLKGTHYADRILPQQSHLLEKAEKDGRVINSVINLIIARVSALMESKSAMEVIVAAPTAGSCGVVGGTLTAVARELGASERALVKSWFAAGMVGALFAQEPGFSAEEYGCQVECGAASGMAAAALAQLMGGSATQSLGAASMAIQNLIGMVCDPVADRVEVPCLGKNVLAAVNAYSSAIMAVAGFDPVIPLDQVIAAVESVGKTMPYCLKCTGKGGLATTDKALEIKKKLAIDKPSDG